MTNDLEGGAVPPEHPIVGLRRDEAGQRAAEAAREDALLRGLCAEGADEVARDTLRGPVNPVGARGGDDGPPAPPE